MTSMEEVASFYPYDLLQVVHSIKPMKHLTMDQASLPKIKWRASDKLISALHIEVRVRIFIFCLHGS